MTKLYMNAGIAAQLGTVRTEPGISQLFHAYETSEHFSQCLQTKLYRFRKPTTVNVN